MSTELVKAQEAAVALAASVSNDNLTNVQRLGTVLAASGYFADVRDMAQAAVKIMAGQELGIAPVAAVMGIHIIKGKITLSGNLIAAQVRRHGCNFRHVEFNGKGCKLEFTGKDGQILGESSFTEEDAKTAGVFSDMYRKFPRNMYFNRAISNGAKWYCPEVTCGLPVYVPEELGASVDGEGEVVLDTPKIDTGGHPMNSRAAQQAVAERKIQELQPDEQPPAPASSSPAPLPAGFGSGEIPGRFKYTPPALAASLPVEQPPAGPPMPQPAHGPPAPLTQETAVVAAPATPLIDPQVGALWKRMSDFAGTVAVFGDLASDITEIAGCRVPYYEILAKYGMKAANDLKGRTRGVVRMAAKEMYEYIQKCKAALAAPPDTPFAANEDDLPPELQGAWKEAA